MDSFINIKGTLDSSMLSSSVNKQQQMLEKLKTGDAKQQAEAAAEFEKFFLSYMMKSIKKTIPKSDLLNHDMSEDVYFDLFLDEVSKQAVASGGGIGLTQQVQEALETVSGSASAGKTGTEKKGIEE